MARNEVRELNARYAAEHPTRIPDIEILAEAVARSRMFGITTKEQALVLMAISQAEGRHPVEAARDYNIIQGRPAKTSEAMLRDFLTSGGRVEWHQLSDDVADATFTHPAGGSIRIVWDQKRVANAGLAGKDMHRKYPRQMLRSRCVSEGVRTVCPMATSGMYVPEEVRDMPAIDTEPSPAANTTADDLDRFATTEDQHLEEVPSQPVTEEDPFGLPPLPIRNEKPSPRRSAIWQEENCRLTPDELFDGTPEWAGWATSIIYFIGEATGEELGKLRDDNKQLLQQLRRSRSDLFDEITVAFQARRAELNKEAK